VYETNDSVAAHLGELSSETAKFRGARGAVIDGGARDTEYMVRLGFPVFCRYRTARDILGRWELQDYNVPIRVGGVPITPGDLVLGDRDGVLIIPQGVAEEVITKAEEVVHTENLVRKAILEGMLPLEAYNKYGRF
jgi:4-hydroxy-4-methyl-2-oxoglutarate aldolase